MKQITVAMLKDQIGTHEVRPFLYCNVCGDENSADRGDYFMVPPAMVFRHCSVPMRLVTARRVFSDVVEGRTP